MKVGHTLDLDGQETPRNATVFRDTTAHIEGAVLLTVAIVGGCGNLLVLATTAACSRFRTTSSAFLSHQCILDAVKSTFCVPFACALLLDVDIPYCNALGSIYIFLMTLTAYNLLAIHINEEYQLTDWQGYIPGKPARKQRGHVDKKNSFWCVSFGIVMIWFTTVLFHLGVAFLPSSAEFSYDIGNCVFNYGTPKNYVIHVLWAMLVTAALLIAVICFVSFFFKLRARMRRDKWTSTQGSLSRDADPAPGTSSTSATACRRHHRMAAKGTPGDTEELHYEFVEAASRTATHQTHLCLRRVVVMLLMVVSFLVFWYPLFILTIVDASYTRPPQTYRICMILAWTHPITTPIFCSIIFFDVVHLETLSRAAYSAAIPLRHSASFASYQQAPRMLPQFNMPDNSFMSENLACSNYSSPRRLWQAGQAEDEPRESMRMLDEMWHRTDVQNVAPRRPDSVVTDRQPEAGFHHSCGVNSRHTLIM